MNTPIAVPNRLPQGNLASRGNEANFLVLLEVMKDTTCRMFH